MRLTRTRLTWLYVTWAAWGITSTRLTCQYSTWPGQGGGNTDQTKVPILYVTRAVWGVTPTRLTCQRSTWPGQGGGHTDQIDVTILRRAGPYEMPCLPTATAICLRCWQSHLQPTIRNKHMSFLIIAKRKLTCSLSLSLVERQWDRLSYFSAVFDPFCQRLT